MQRLKVFFVFFVSALCWFIVPNYFLPVLLTMSVMCWAGTIYEPVCSFGSLNLCLAEGLNSHATIPLGIPSQAPLPRVLQVKPFGRSGLKDIRCMRALACTQSNGR